MSEVSAPVTEGAVAEIRRGVTRLAHRLRAERPAGALSANKINVLGHLYRRGPSTPGEVAAAAFQQPQSLTKAFAELEAAGLVTRRPSDHDRRASVLTITETGCDALTRDMAQRETWLAEALTGRTRAEVELLRVAAVLMDEIADTPGGER
ncbi:MarR family winged helix-turn-helix transcriptional regulator [Actinomadura sp. DC4]|uniref:MarR family winged helix-turn-helix transcriptional regulator n=1 Tax=Actinomadura sp. DC4 TaxID=3055069 RepID=UPI0025AFAA05|nr:MarR family winged helix-turn-helix transcriptional regulator [Actinomadura sp. DC4]MDN3354392.1 MarR family winged helix-turn-helix transcriptional regulator [Actinomadura sp. DC4]